MRKVWGTLFGMLFAAAGSSPLLAATTYEIEVAYNDERFIINGEKYEAKTYCIGWAVGDRVVFLEGSPYGVCVSAVLYNVDRDKTCHVWCE